MEIFVSYAWGGENEEIVNEIYNIFQQKGIKIIRDKIDLGYKGNIKEFMQKIGKGDAIIVVISDKYLKSENCMFELLEIHKSKDIWKRIFPIVLPDAKIYDEVDRIDYLNYWDDKIQQLKDKIKTIENPVGIGQVVEKMNQFNDIRRVNDELMDMLRNMNTLTVQMHKSSQFADLLKAVEQFAQENEDPTVNSVEVSVNVQENNIAKTKNDNNSSVTINQSSETILNDIQTERNKSILKRLEMLNKLLTDYEDKLALEDDPRKTMLFEKEIDKLKKQIETIRNEMK
jgi:hypothetical protein